MDNEDFVTVYTTSRPDEAAIVKLRLEQADVPYLTRNDVVSSVLPFDGMAEVEFEVRREDAERAREALRLPAPADG